MERLNAVFGTILLAGVMIAGLALAAIKLTEYRQRWQEVREEITTGPEVQFDLPDSSEMKRRMEENTRAIREMQRRQQEQMRGLRERLGGGR